MTVRLNNKDYLWSYLGIIVSLGSNVVLLPFVLHYLSEDMYGLWGVFQSFASITTLFDFGFSVTFARNINYAWSGAADLKKTGAVYAEEGRPNFHLMKRTMTACRYVFLLLSILALLFMALPGTAYIRYICRDVSVQSALIAWAFYVVAIFLNLYYGYFNAFLRGVGAISAANRVAVIARFAQITLTVILLVGGAGIVGMGAAYLLYGVLLRLLSKRAFLRYQGIGEGLTSVQESFSPTEIKDTFLIVWHNASRDGIVTLANYLANQACTLISPLYMTLAETGVYALAVQLASILANVSGTLYNANQPVLQSAYISNDRELTRRTMSLIVVSFLLLYTVGMLALVFIGLPMLRLVKPGTTPGVAVMLGVGFYQFMLMFRNCYTSYFSCSNRVPYAKAFLFSSVLCVALAVGMLSFGWGIWGLICAQIISQGCYNFWVWPLKAHREMRLGIQQTWEYGREELLKILHRGGEADNGSKVSNPRGR